MIDALKTAMFSVMVYRVEIIRLRAGPDHLYLRTNLPNPVWPYTGTLAIRLAVTRGTGRQWVKENLKAAIEVSEVDLETRFLSREDEGKLASGAPLAPDETVASVEDPSPPERPMGSSARPVLSLRRHR